MNERSRASGTLSQFPLGPRVAIGVCTLLVLLSALRAPVLAQDQKISFLLREGREALDSGDFARAAQDFEQARQLAPDDLEANRGLLLSDLQDGRLDQAE